MNRKECEKALEMLKEYAMEMVEDESLDGEIFYEWYHLNEGELRQCTAPLEELIEEHFHNQPLKFEELEEGETYYHVYYGWISIRSLIDSECILINTLNSDGYKQIEFEEDCFYRKQVE